jgi:thymidylate kinase
MTTLVLMAERGKYIVLEGGDNVGKTTQQEY